jgi:sugar phosphate isomerase/epimerase
MTDASQQQDAGNLSVTLSPLVRDDSGDAIKASLDRIANLRLRFVQISATMGGLRPRDLDHTARRDLLAALRRRELSLSGLDAWIPAAHFFEPAHVDRAVQAMSEIIELAADLGRVPVSVTLPHDPDALEATSTLARLADRLGVSVADHAIAISPIESVGVGIDPAAQLANISDPMAAIHAAGPQRLVSARLCDLYTSGMRGPVGVAGQSRLDVTGYRVALEVNGYCRPVVIDARQWNEPWRGVEQTMTVWGRGEQARHV